MIRLRTLGTLDLRGFRGEELRAVLAQPKRAALLAYLALAVPRGTQRRDTILTIFWPELDTERARNALGQAVHFLRRSLGADVIVNRNGDGLAIDWERFWCDAAAFEDALDAGRVGEAIAQYRGDLLEGFHIADAPEFERWLDSERARLSARCSKALEQIATERQGAGDLQGAIMHWRTLASRDPYSSRLTLHLMRALKAAGDPASALLEARNHERLLREELGIAPDPELVALVGHLQREQPPPAVPAREPSARKSIDHETAMIDRPAPSASSALRLSRRVTLLAAGVAVLSLGTAEFIRRQPADSTVVQQADAVLASDGANAVPSDVYVRDMYVRGRNAELSRSEVGLATARNAYEQAIARDSSFALGYAGLASVYRHRGVYGFSSLRPALDSARLMARRALALDSTLSETRTTIATALADGGAFEAAEREFVRAVELNPRDASAHFWYSMLLIALGRAEEARREIERAAELDPLVSPRGVQALRRYVHWLLTGERPHFQLPVRERRPSLKVEPGDPWAIARQAEDLAETSDCTAARVDIERAQRLAPDNVRMRPFMARVDWWCGDRTRARALVDDIKRRPDARDYAFDVALIHTLFGEKDSAFVWLAQNSWTVTELAQLSASHYLDPLRPDPRFLRLQRRLRVRP